MLPLHGVRPLRLAAVSGNARFLREFSTIGGARDEGAAEGTYSQPSSPPSKPFFSFDR